jgi:hypothetical protein
MYHTVPLNAKSQNVVPSFFDFLWFFLKGLGNPPSPITSQAAIAEWFAVNEVVGVNTNASTQKLHKLIFMCKSKKKKSKCGTRELE